MIELAMKNVTIRDVRKYWEANPLCASAIPHPLGSKEYFDFYDGLREANETPDFSARLHEYHRFVGKNVLDVGCGNGYVLSRYARQGASVTGIDVTAVGAELSRKRFEHMELPGTIMQANAEELPFGDGSFDCVCSMGVLHHTPDTARAISEIRRVLRPGGRLIVMFYHRDSAMYRIKFPLIRLLQGKPLGQSVNEVDGYGNPKGEVYSKTELCNLLRGFRDIEMFAGCLQGWMVLPWEGLVPNWALKPFERLMGWFLYAKAYKA